MTQKHDWASYQTYINAHERVLRTYAKFMEYPKRYKLDEVNENWFILSCKELIFTTYNGGKIRVDIIKDVEVDVSVPQRKKARTFAYSYSCSRPGGSRLIRYDSPDTEVGPKTPDHHRYHHKHDFTSGKEVITKVADDAWPHVSDFFNEVLTSF